MSNLLDTIGENIKNIRKAKGITQKELSQLTHIAQSQLSKIENGAIEPMISTLSKIAKVLDVSVIDFLQDNWSKDKALLQKLNALDGHDKQSIIDMIDMAMTKKQLGIQLKALSEQSPSNKK